MKSFDSSGERSFVSAKPACVVAGFLLCHSVEALVPRAPITEIRSHQRRSCVRPRGAGGLRCSTSEGGAENVDSSEIYAAVRNRLKVGDWECGTTLDLGVEDMIRCEVRLHRAHIIAFM